MKKLSSVLGIPAEAINFKRPIFDCGVDSLLAIDLRSWFKKEFNSNVSVFDMMGNYSLTATCRVAVTKSLWYQGPDRLVEVTAT